MAIGRRSLFAAHPASASCIADSERQVGKRDGANYGCVSIKLLDPKPGHFVVGKGVVQIERGHAHVRMRRYAPNPLPNLSPGLRVPTDLPLCRFEKFVGSLDVWLDRGELNNKPISVHDRSHRVVHVCLHALASEPRLRNWFEFSCYSNVLLSDAMLAKQAGSKRHVFAEIH